MITFDSNILVYVADADAGERHTTAVAVVDQAIRDGAVVFLLQSFVEFFHVTVRKGHLTPSAARDFIRGWQAVAPVKPYIVDDLQAAIETVLAHKLSFFDTLLWATADRVGVTYLITEDQQDGRRLGRVTFVDPFAARNRALLGLD